jgi:hypothetical protein
LIVLADAVRVHVGTVARGAEHEAFVPPALPAHVHAHCAGVSLVTALAVPLLQSPAEGAKALGTPFAKPQAPLMTESPGVVAVTAALCAEQLAAASQACTV